MSIKRCRSRLNLPGAHRGTLGTLPLTLWHHHVLLRVSGRLHKCKKLRRECSPSHSCYAFLLCLGAKAPRFTLHRGFNHEGSLKAHTIKGGRVQCSPALMLHESRWRQAKRMDAGKGAAREKEIPATNKSPSNLS